MSKDVDDNGTEVNDGDPFSDSIPQRLVALVDGKFMSILMALLTIFVLWGDDFRLSAFTKDADVFFYAIFTVSIFLFLGEFFVNTIAKKAYKWSFFFWLDFIAGASIAPDIPWIVDFFGDITSSESSTEGSSVASSVESARTARIVRLVRLLRLIRIVKLYSMMRKASQAESEEKLRAQALAAQNAKQAALKRVEASQLGKVLSEMTTRRVVIMVLMMLFANPLLNFTDNDTSKQFGLSQIFWFGQSSCEPDDAYFACEYQTEPWMSKTGWQNLIYLYSQVQRDHLQVHPPDADDNLLWLYVPNLLNDKRLEAVRRVESSFGVWEEDAQCAGIISPEDCQYRDSELEFVSFQPFECDQEVNAGCNHVKVFARFEIAQRMRIEANYRMITTVFVCILLGSMSIQFQNDTQSLVIAPIEKMVNIIKQLAVDPLRKPDLLVVGYDEIEDSTAKAAPAPEGRKRPQLETAMLENTILKIGGLLQVGFGEAGAQIIGKNMSSGDGELNIMMPGIKINGIFGFVDIRQFSDITTCLQEEVLIFTNTVSTILHNCTTRWGGIPNLNLGDSYLLLWKLPDQDVRDKPENEASAVASNTATKALIGMLKFMVECKRSEGLQIFGEQENMTQLFGPDYTLEYGIGLHAGWAIEGPIGSEFKLDAGYISPYFNFTIEIQEATKHYKTPLLMSEKFYNMLCIRNKEKIRKLDVIMSFHEPQGVYCFPVNDKLVDAPKNHVTGELIMTDGLDLDLPSIERDCAEYIFGFDEDLKDMQEGIPETINQYYRQALSAYISGEWDEAKEYFEKTLEVDPNDSPSQVLLAFMKKHEFEAPEEWPGFRTLI